MSTMLLGMDRVCKAYIAAQIAASSWADVPVTLRLLMNHYVREDALDAASQPYAGVSREEIARCHTLQRTAVHYHTLQRTATHCHTLQRTATHTATCC